MAQAVCWALFLLAVARTEARYADYSGAKMPQYGGGGGTEYDGPRDVMAAAPPEDYVEPPAAASIAADYKYDDDSAQTEKVSNKEVEDSRERQTISNRHRPVQVLDEDNTDHLDFSEDRTKSITTRQFPKPRIQTRARNSDVRESRRHAIRHNRNKFKETDVEENDNIHVHREDLPRQKLLHSDNEESNIKNHVHRDEIRRRKGDDDALMTNDDINFKHDEPLRKNGLEIDDDNIDDKDFVYRTTTMRVARRKPRDRYVKRPSGFEEQDDDMWQNRLVSANRRNFEKYPPHEERPKVSGRRRLENEKINEDIPLVSSRRNYVSSDDDDDTDKRVIPKYKDTNAKSDEYQDYSYDMKRVEGIRERLPVLIHRTSTARRPTTTMAKNPDLREMIMANRRAMVPFPKKTTISTTTSTTTTTSTEPFTAGPQYTTPTNATTDADTVIISSTDIEEVLSLAEKSRLSILKKSQKKESEKGTITKKPVVLMQVTRQMHTLVMVEPPTSIEPWMRAKVVSNDSPSRLKKVKRLMRQKLVQNAKSIHDLTENWDEMVCDYVDVALVDTNGGNICFIGQSLVSITLLILASCV